MDICFFYICQLIRYGHNLKYIVTTTDSLFQAKLKNIYPKFKQDPNVILKYSSLLEDITGARILLSFSGSDMNTMLMPIL